MLFKDLLPETFIILDTEYTSWKGSQERNWSRKNEHKELVQISAIKIKKTKKTLKLVKKINIYVKPQINPQLSEYFINLTNISQETIDKKGISFNEAMKKIYDFCKNNKNEKYPILSYGNDYGVIKENLKLNKVNKTSRYYKWEDCFYDVSFFFDLFTDSSKYSSGTIYKAFNITPNEKASVHNALWDCISIYISLKHNFNKEI